MSKAPIQFRGAKIGVKSADGTWLREGDKILVNVQRLSSSHSTWYQKTNKHHGTYQLPAIVCYVGAMFFPRYLKEDIMKLEKPKGQEKFNQVIRYPTEHDAWWEDSFHVGSIYPKNS